MQWELAKTDELPSKEISVIMRTFIIANLLLLLSKALVNTQKNPLLQSEFFPNIEIRYSEF